MCTEATALIRDGMNSQLDTDALRPLAQTGRAAAARNAYFRPSPIAAPSPAGSTCPQRTVKCVAALPGHGQIPAQPDRLSRSAIPG